MCLATMVMLTKTLRSIIHFVNDPEYIGASLNHVSNVSNRNDIYTMICHKVTSGQRKIIKQRCFSIDEEKYKTLITCLYR